MTEVLADSYSGSMESPIPIGRVNENISRQVVFDITTLDSLYGEGTAKVLVVNPGETDYHEATSAVFNGMLYWTVSADETKRAGNGVVQVHYIPKDSARLYKSKLKHTVVFDSLHGENT
jgi:hypothetical protein